MSVGIISLLNVEGPKGLLKMEEIPRPAINVCKYPIR